MVEPGRSTNNSFWTHSWGWSRRVSTTYLYQIEVQDQYYNNLLVHKDLRVDRVLAPVLLCESPHSVKSQGKTLEPGSPSDLPLRFYHQWWKVISLSWYHRPMIIDI